MIEDVLTITARDVYNDITKFNVPREILRRRLEATYELCRMNIEKIRKENIDHEMILVKVIPAGSVPDARISLVKTSGSTRVEFNSC